MHLLNEALARAHCYERLAEADAERRANGARKVQRLERRAARAARRARRLTAAALAAAGRAA
ncbi:hypothetical protein [Phytoactinopolyspora endophytica]|uniref:hypothetical protein n=1 Tax=Phytoactinopolyspora endophytica TaxID=1642495 RepID=UPI00101C190A|nr:hypothetical protein [Phytoactinopolyspora endophytica]